MHLILPTSYRSQSSCTKFARKIGLPWPACPCANREVGGGDCESPLSPEKLARQEKVIASGFYREWEKEPNVSDFTPYNVKLLYVVARNYYISKRRRN